MPANEDACSISIELQPFYHDVKNTIVRPRQVVMGTRYFWEKWAPLLGPTLTVLIVRLRMHCYYNQATQERRDWCFPTQQTLADETGVSRWTVMRELKKPLARQFVRVQPRSRYDTVRKQTVRVSSLYHVAMDDPLIDEDRTKAAAMLACGEGASEPLAPVAVESVQAATGPIGSNLPLEEELEELSNDVVVVAQELVGQQVTPSVAHRLARHYPAEIIRDKMTLVRQYQQENIVRNPAGLLRRAIEDGYHTVLRATGTESGRTPLLELRTPPLRATCTLQPVIDRLGGSNRRVNVWEVAKAELADSMTPAAFGHWLEPSKLLTYDHGRVQVGVPDARIQRYIEQRLRPAIEQALNLTCGSPVSLEVVVEGANPNV
jgi:hypothetical protein